MKHRDFISCFDRWNSQRLHHADSQEVNRCAMILVPLQIGAQRGAKEMVKKKHLDFYPQAPIQIGTQLGVAMEKVIQLQDFYPQAPIHLGTQVGGVKERVLQSGELETMQRDV